MLFLSYQVETVAQAELEKTEPVSEAAPSLATDPERASPSAEEGSGESPNGTQVAKYFPTRGHIC